MIETCHEPSYSILPLIWLHPLGAALVLLAIGAASAFIWTRMRGRWRWIALVLPAIPLTLLVAEPIRLELKMREAKAMLASGKWREAEQSYSLVLAKATARAFPVPMGSKCMRGFIISLQDPASAITDRLDRAYGDGPDAGLLHDIADLERSPYSKCMERLYILHGSDKAPIEQCRSLKQPPLQFHRDLSRPIQGLEMAWCRPLNSQHFYCEATSLAVAVASGYKF